VIRLRSLGDAVMLTPPLAALHAWRPDLRIMVLMQPEFAPVFERNPAVAEILAYRGFATSARALRRRQFAVTFNQHGGPTSAFLTAAIASPVRVCWRRCRFGFFYNVRAPEPLPGAEPRPHTVIHRMQQFYAAGLPAGPIPPARVYPDPAAAARVVGRLATAGISSGAPYAVLHPGAAYFTKRWSLDGFAQMAGWLREQRGVFPVVILGPGERAMAGEWRARLRDSVRIFDDLALDELIALIAGARLFLGNDSGPAHLATAAGRPGVVIFGSSDSLTWRPWQTPHRAVQNDFPCNPCRGDRCYAFSEPRCILSVTPEQVQAACIELLETRT
jgi:ADP-heptose:LPS heptosyltransferase